ncbi:MAG: HPr family phosphocarrier protein [Deferribacteraceae bacterium]|jgi:phosphocarrier protein|nr:HPr family phosphocarrier protein [Deferribacteraceae bacterium]
MKSFTYAIQDELGIHARPAGLMVKAARPFACDISVEYNGKKADMKKPFGLMGLAAKQGDELTIICNGADEEEAVATLQQFLRENL